MLPNLNRSAPPVHRQIRPKLKFDADLSAPSATSGRTGCRDVSGPTV